MIKYFYYFDMWRSSHTPTRLSPSLPLVMPLWVRTMTPCDSFLCDLPPNSNHNDLVVPHQPDQFLIRSRKKSRENRLLRPLLHDKKVQQSPDPPFNTPSPPNRPFSAIFTGGSSPVRIRWRVIKLAAISFSFVSLLMYPHSNLSWLYQQCMLFRRRRLI